MKIKSLFLFSTCTHLCDSKFGVWVTNKYCDYNQELFDEQSLSPNTGLLMDSQCADFCKEKTEKLPEPEDEDQYLCCDYEQWSDGSYNCYLYGANPDGKDSQIEVISRPES